MSSSRTYSRAVEAFRGAANNLSVLREALKSPTDRSTPLRYVYNHASSHELEALLPELVDRIMFGHPAIAMARDALKKVNRSYLLTHIEEIAHALIERDWKGPDEYEPYRRLAEFFKSISANEHLRRLIDQASADVREVAEDFESPPSSIDTSVTAPEK